MDSFFRSIFMAITTMALLTTTSLAQSKDSKAEIIFAKGYEGSSNFSNGDLGRGTTFLWVFSQIEGRSPVDGKVDITNAVLVVDNAQYRREFYAGDAINSEMSLIYKHSKVVDFFVDITTGKDPTKELGIISVKGSRDNFRVHISEQHTKDAIHTPGDWDATEGFGLRITRESLNGYCAEHLYEEHNLTQTKGPGCFWEENKSGNFCWVDPPSGQVSFERCQKLDTCNGGGGLSNGGCYKYADSPDAPGRAWE